MKKQADANALVEDIQRAIGAGQDGMWGKETSTKFRTKLEDLAGRLNITLTGGKFTKDVATALENAVSSGQITNAADLAFAKATLALDKGRHIDTAGNHVTLRSLYDPRHAESAPQPAAQTKVPDSTTSPQAATVVLPPHPTSRADLSGILDAGLGTSVTTAAPSLYGPARPAFPFPPRSAGSLRETATQQTSAFVMRDGLSRLSSESITLLDAARLYNTYRSPNNQTDTGLAMERLEHLGLDSRQSFDPAKPGEFKNLMTRLVAYAHNLTPDGYAANPQRSAWEREIDTALASPAAKNRAKPLIDPARVDDLQARLLTAPGPRQAAALATFAVGPAPDDPFPFARNSLASTLIGRDSNLHNSSAFMADGLVTTSLDEKSKGHNVSPPYTISLETAVDLYDSAAHLNPSMIGSFRGDPALARNMRDLKLDGSRIFDLRDPQQFATLMEQISACIHGKTPDSLDASWKKEIGAAASAESAKISVPPTVGMRDENEDQPTFTPGAAIPAPFVLNMG